MFSGWVEAFPWYKADAFTVAKKPLENVFLTWDIPFTVSGDQVICPLHWANHLSLSENLVNFLELSPSLSPSIIKQG